MANSTLSQLKIGSLRRAGNYYNASDATLLTIAGGLINDILGYIQTVIKGHPFTIDLDNTVSTVANQAYVDLTPTDIIEITAVYQRETDTKLRQITRTDYVDIAPDNTIITGVPEVAWFPAMTVDVTGNNDWQIWLLPTPSSVITLRYDYVKNLKFSTDSADSEFSKLPPTYDEWIYAEFKPRLYEILDPNNRTKIDNAYKLAAQIGNTYRQSIVLPADMIQKVASSRSSGIIINNVASTPIPS